MLKYGRVLIVGDFNNHGCCPDEPMALYFFIVIDSFSLVQYVSGPTQECRHTINYIFACF